MRSINLRIIAPAVLVPSAVALALVLAATAFWLDLDAGSRRALAEAITFERTAMVGLIVLPALVATALLLAHRALQAHRRALRLAEATRVIARVQPGQRLPAGSDDDLDAIAAAVNDLAGARATLLAQSGERIDAARAALESERNRLAALIAEMEQSVLVCNREGRILLYNAAVARLLERRRNESGVTIGLGRSVFGVLDRHLIQHVVDTLEGMAAQGHRRSMQFVAGDDDGRVLRMSVAPVFGAERGPSAGASAVPALLNGFVLLITDVTESAEADARSVALYQDLAQGARATIAAIGGALQSLGDGAQAANPALVQALGTVHAEVDRLAQRLDSLNTDVADRLRRRWPLEDMRGADLLALACKRVERDGLAASVQEVDEELWLRVDSFALVQAIGGLARRLAEEFAVAAVRMRLAPAPQGAHLDLCWKGVPMSSETAYHWQNETFALAGGERPLSLAQVMERHGGEAWYQRDAPSQTNFFRMQLPRAASQSPAAVHLEPLAARPEFYDFDLFRASAAGQAWEGRQLADVPCTVFDTETTGLAPADGDRIISIGAVRIVNGRLLRRETFETLVQADRAISAASTAVHGITAAMLEGQPRIEQALPRFWRFAEDTILVAHNAAFDMRFLQVQEAACAVRFDQPVLDTLLLAALVHPSEPSQALEAIAERLGISVIGRHTALGDALTTAEVFLALLPLLAARGIHTVGEALQASQKTYYARLNY